MFVQPFQHCAHFVSELVVVPLFKLAHVKYGDEERQSDQQRCEEDRADSVDPPEGKLRLIVVVIALLNLLVHDMDVVKRCDRKFQARFKQQP